MVPGPCSRDLRHSVANAPRLNGDYPATLHYLIAVESLKDKDPTKVMARMKEVSTDDPVFGNGSIRPDGRKIHDMHLFEVKKPGGSRGERDLYKLLATAPADQAIRPPNEDGCPLVKG